jgi:hypothetical protein
MNISTSWLIYILVTVVAYLILKYVATNLMGSVKLMIALLVGALAVFLSAPSLDIESGMERIWMGVLFVVAYVAPIIMGLYIIWKGGYFNETLCVRPESRSDARKTR